MELGNLLFGNSRGNYPVPRGFSPETFEWQDRFDDFLAHIECDSYGNAASYTNLFKFENRRGGITTELFEVNPYYWGEEARELVHPNFIYYPINYKLKWYKYPLRDSYANKNVTFEEFDEMLTECERYYERIKC